MTRCVVLDNEAVQALQDQRHRKHRQVVSHVQVVADRKQRGLAVEIVVPTAVRVEAGWDRTSAEWAFPNRLRIGDRPLDSSAANSGATVRRRTGVSVADAHVGAVIHAGAADQVTVVTSDPNDIRAVAEGRHVTIVSI
jgi:hypothetical protein